MHNFRPILVLVALLCCSIARGQQSNRTAPPSPVPATPPASREFFHIYLLMGQSNMAGRGDLRQSASPTGSQRVLSLNPDNQWVVAKDPLHRKVGRIEPGVGPGMSFALEMLKTLDPKVTIGLVPCAVGGTPLSRWSKGKKGDLYSDALKRAKLAAKAGVIKGVLWHQGEADTVKQGDAESYEARLARMFKDLRADLEQPELPIVVGQLGDFLSETPEKNPHAETVRAALKHVPQAVPNVGFADSAGLNHKGDKLHFNAEGAKELGIRYSKAMQQIQKP